MTNKNPNDMRKTTNVETPPDLATTRMTLEAIGDALEANRDKIIARLVAEKREGVIGGKRK